MVNVKKALTLLLVLFLAVTLAPASVLAKKKVLKVGVLAPLTGASARAGKEHKGSVLTAFEEVNYKIGDYDVELVWIDSEGDPEKASRAYEAAILRDRIDAGLLGWHSSVCAALMQSAARNRIPHFFALGGSGVINEKYASDPERFGYWAGKGWAMPKKMTVAYVETIEGAIAKGLWSPRNKKVAIFGEDTDWGRSYGNGLTAQFKAAGWDVVSQYYFSAQETDLFPLIVKMRDLDASVVAGTISNPPTQAAFIKQSKEVGLKSLVIVDSLGETGDWYALTKDASNYVLDNRPIWSTERSKKFAADFEKEYGVYPGPAAAGLAYDWSRNFISMANEALKVHGKLDRETLFQFFNEKVRTGEFTFKGGIVMEEYKYTPESFPDPVVGGGYFIFPVIQYMNGQGNIVWPDSIKNSEVQIPEVAK